MGGMGWSLLVAMLLAVSIGALLGTFAWRRMRRRAAAAALLRTEALAQAREQAARAERERIYNDLHDDLGARLLQLIYTAPDPSYADLARAALQDLRDVVTRSRGTVGSLEDVLSDIRAESTQRLAAASIPLRWEQPPALPPGQLDPARALHLYRIVREAISNALRHARPHTLRIRVRCTPQRLDIELTDDGPDGPPSTHEGRGMRNMRERTDQLNGEIAWTRGTEGGTKVLLSMPLAELPEAHAGAVA